MPSTDTGGCAPVSVGRGSRQTREHELGRAAEVVRRRCVEVHPDTVDLRRENHQLLEQEDVLCVHALRDGLHVPAARVVDLGLELVDHDVDGEQSRVSEVADQHSGADTGLDVLRAAELSRSTVAHSDVHAHEQVDELGDLGDPVDVAGHDDSSEVDVQGVNPVRFFEYLTLYTVRGWLWSD